MSRDQRSNDLLIYGLLLFVVWVYCNKKGAASLGNSLLELKNQVNFKVRINSYMNFVRAHVCQDLHVLLFQKPLVLLYA
ncbi:hypothetical protein SAMN03080601_01021 [Alkalitalea saponilacus]|uniref:Uncharacterized protein n=1 Tax=Alkalitalea saponilacus TaxID=889453 RepID=A0A1T5D7Z1_9BACT|nr:hypothetical protein SAMN03080601_01021 [Alkalitalea saponilacus]